MNQQKLQELFERIDSLLHENNATLSDVRIISMQLQDMVENYKLQNAIRDFQTFLVENKTITQEDVDKYIQNKNPKVNP